MEMVLRALAIYLILLLVFKVASSCSVTDDQFRFDIIDYQ